MVPICSGYALADLDDDMLEHCDWWALPRGLALVFRALAIRPVFVLGDAVATKKLLETLAETTGYLNLKAHQIDAAEGIYRYRERHDMRQVFLDAFQPRSGITEPTPSKGLQRYRASLRFRRWRRNSFAPFQLETGFFRGIRRDGELVAVASVQVASRKEGVAAVGNIFTRPDCRGQGLAQTVTSAVASAIRDAGIQTIGLNVESTNAAAIRAYERVGFRTHFSYSEGIADRLGTNIESP